MTNTVKRLMELFPDKIIVNISRYPDLYYAILNEASRKELSIKVYLKQLGFTYGEDATILILEDEIKQGIKQLKLDILNPSILNEAHLYSSIGRVARFYGISIKEFIESMGYKYTKHQVNASSIDYNVAKKLKEVFGFTLVEIGDIVGVSRQRVEQILKKGNASSADWITNDVDNVKEIFIDMSINHIYERTVGDTRFIIRNNGGGEICLLWYDESYQYCAFNENIPEDLFRVIKQEKMDYFLVEDYLNLENIEIVNRLKKPYVKPTDKSLYKRARDKRGMNNDEYAIFLGYCGYITDKDINVDRRIIEYFDNNLIDGEVYISSEVSNQWIRNFASGNGMELEELVEFFGYKKAVRGKYSELEEYINNEKEKLRQELAAISINGFVQPQGNLYQRLYIFGKKNSKTILELIHELGFKRSLNTKFYYEIKSDNIILNELDELNKEIEKALKYEKEYFESEEKEISQIKRNVQLVAKLKNIYGYRCQLCNDDECFPIQKKDGTYYVEVHHIKPIAEGRDEETTLDILSNMIVVCPNHHKFLHFHNGGFRNIKKENNNYLFFNEKNDKIFIVKNYHLKEI